MKFHIPVIALALLTGCAPAIVGKWQCKRATMEFLKDGTFVVSDSVGTWQDIGNGKIKTEIPQGKAVNDFEIKDGKLRLDKGEWCEAIKP